MLVELEGLSLCGRFWESNVAVRIVREDDCFWEDEPDFWTE